MRTRTAMTAAALFAAGAVLAPATARAEGGTSTRHDGTLTSYSAVADNPTTGVQAAVHVVDTGNRTTRFTLHVWGFAPDDTGHTYGAHFHTGDCADGVNAGGHYAHPTAIGTLEEREVWLDFTVNASGNGYATASRPWVVADGAAGCLVVHADATMPNGTAGPRLACLLFEP
jgi:Cu/Zn superoxide dismutase